MTLRIQSPWILLCCITISASSVKIYNNSDCCCEDVYPRGPQNLVDDVNGCIANCQADSKCQAAVLITGAESVAQQCQLKGPAPAGKLCCIHKAHFDSLNQGRFHKAHLVVIDLETTSGSCPRKKPTPVPPIPSPAPPPSPAPDGPLQCQPFDLRPTWPIFHTIGNVTTGGASGPTLSGLNDANAIFEYKGVYHVRAREFVYSLIDSNSTLHFAV